MAGHPPGAARRRSGPSPRHVAHTSSNSLRVRSMGEDLRSSRTRRTDAADLHDPAGGWRPEWYDSLSADESPDPKPAGFLEAKNPDYPTRRLGRRPRRRSRRATRWGQDGPPPRSSLDGRVSDGERGRPVAQRGAARIEYIQTSILCTTDNLLVVHVGAQTDPPRQEQGWRPCCEPPPEEDATLRLSPHPGRTPEKKRNSLNSTAAPFYWSFSAIDSWSFPAIDLVRLLRSRGPSAPDPGGRLADIEGIGYPGQYR